MNDTQLDRINQKVKRWNTIFGNPEGCISNEKDESVRSEMIQNELDMIKEELEELRVATLNGDKVEMLDAKLDTAFVTLGFVHKMGWAFISAIYTCHFGKRTIEKAIKTLDNIRVWVEEPDGSNLIVIVSHYLHLAEDEAGDRVYEAMMEVVRSNFSKFPMEKDENGKVKKSENFIPPNLKPYTNGGTFMYRIKKSLGGYEEDTLWEAIGDKVYDLSPLRAINVKDWVVGRGMKRHRSMLWKALKQDNNIHDWDTAARSFDYTLYEGVYEVTKRLLSDECCVDFEASGISEELEEMLELSNRLNTVRHEEESAFMDTRMRDGWHTEHDTFFKDQEDKTVQKNKRLLELLTKNLRSMWR